MGLMDRLNAGVANLQQQASAGMAKLDNMPQQRKADALLRGLGIALLAERTGRAAPDAEAQITQLVAELQQHEQQNNIDLVQQAAQAAAQAAAQQAQQQQWQAQQAQQGGYLNQSPPVGSNVPSAGFPGQQQGGFPGQQQAPGGIPGQQAPGGFPGQAQNQGPLQPGFQPHGPQQGQPQQQQQFFPANPQQQAPTGFPPANPQQQAPTGFPPAAPVGNEEPDSGSGGQNQSFFPPSS